MIFGTHTSQDRTIAYDISSYRCSVCFSGCCCREWCLESEPYYVDELLTIHTMLGLKFVIIDDFSRPDLFCRVFLYKGVPEVRGSVCVLWT